MTVSVEISVFELLFWRVLPGLRFGSWAVGADFPAPAVLGGSRLLRSLDRR